MNFSVEEENLICMYHTSDPVSYTHLDVYKRQNENCSLCEKSLRNCTAPEAVKTDTETPR